MALHVALEVVYTIHGTILNQKGGLARLETKLDLCSCRKLITKNDLLCFGGILAVYFYYLDKGWGNGL